MLQCKNLLDIIDAHREVADQAQEGTTKWISLQKAVALKQVIQEIRETADEKNTLTEFYDTLERIVNELRGVPDHATAFLARVRKADAPNYFTIIKHPMDLGTILKKVKQHQYKDKKSFADDVHLVWNNCFEYNSWTEHPLRKSATIMQAKTNHLLQFVTDVPIRPSAASGSVRSGSVVAASDADAEGDTDEEADETNLTRKGQTSRKRTGDKGTQSQPQAKAEDTGDFDFGDLPTSVDPERIDASVEGTPDLPPSTRNRSRSPSLPVRRGASLLNASSNRKRMLTARTDLVPFEERVALVRTTQGMSTWFENEREADATLPDRLTIDDLDQPDARDTERQETPVNQTADGLSPLPSASQRNSQLSPAVRKPMPLAVQQLSGRPSVALPSSREPSAVPEPVTKTKEQAWWEQVAQDAFFRTAVPDLPFKSCSSHESSHSTVTESESRTGSLTHRIRQNIKTVQTLKNMRDHTESSTAVDAEPATLATSASTLNADNSLHRLATELALHAGYDAVHARALHVLTDVIIHFITNLARTARFLVDLYAQKLEPSHLLSRLLDENGIDINSLSSYVNVDVTKYGSQLQNLLAKAEKVIHSRQSDADENVGVVEPLSVQLKLDPPIPFVSLDEEGAIAAQIGLLQSYFARKEDTEGHIEADFSQVGQKRALDHDKETSAKRLKT